MLYNSWKGGYVDYPDVLQGTYVESSCDSVLKRVYPFWWRANGIRFVNARDLTMCKADYE